MNINKIISEAINEKLNPKDGAGEYIDDFQDSDAPQFKGKSKEKRRKMALAAFMKDKENMNEEIHKQVAEVLKKVKQPDEDMEPEIVPTFPGEEAEQVEATPKVEKLPKITKNEGEVKNKIIDNT